MSSTSFIHENKNIQEIESVVIRFAGDSGDGMQLTGSQFTNTSAVLGNDISTLPDFPAEIRAPAGSLPGVSAFQLNFSSSDIRTPGDQPDVLVAMNPAALKTNLKDLPHGGMLIVNQDAFIDRNLERAGYTSNPLEDDSLKDYRLIKVPMNTLNQNALEAIDLPGKAKEKCKNFFALGMMYWMYDRSMDVTLEWIKKKFGKNPNVVEANSQALKSGYYFAETSEIVSTHYKIKPARLAPGTYRNIMGNQATAIGLLAASELAKTPLVYCSYPITPASDVLHELSKFKNFGLKTLQNEDEIAAIGAAIGAAFGGAIAVTGTSGPGLALKSEALNLALMVELPLIVLNVQRGGPSTGLPTKTEQSDLLQALFGRNGDSPIPVIAAATPSDCFYMAIEATRIAIKYMTPVILLTDGYLANGSEPWKIPQFSELKSISVKHPEHLNEEQKFQPYLRDEETLARPWAVPGTKGFEHRIGGLEKENISGNVSYDPLNHQKMTDLRKNKVRGIVQDIPDLEVYGDQQGEVLIVGWGGTCGAITSATEKLRKQGLEVSCIHIRYLNPFPKNLGEILGRFNKILVPELNTGQLCMLLRAKYLVDAQSLSKVQGKPFKISEIMEAAQKLYSKDQEVKNVAGSR
ncbi:MAG: 2-oxoacid:acceptor oxidoreductase subunit alpha [Deltaproteobacteria bacterium]|nr:2-oxoacid:acceptor oxidoreductase subunit alpha [Deltaproteobacteria bacterium]